MVRAVLRTGPLPNPLADETWRYAIIGGLVTLPWTALLYWQSADQLSLGPVLVGGVVAGYLCRGDDTDCRRAGAGVGLIGALPALWVAFELLTAASGMTGPAWFRIAAIGLGVGSLLAFLLVGFGLAALLGAVGAAVDNWASKKTGRQRPPVVGG